MTVPVLRDLAFDALYVELGDHTMGFMAADAESHGPDRDAAYLARLARHAQSLAFRREVLA
jgi:hypothetical protein